MYSDKKMISTEIGEGKIEQNLPPIQNEVKLIYCNLEVCEKLQTELISRLNIILNQDSCTEKIEQDSRVEIPIPLCNELRNITNRLEVMIGAFNSTLDRLGI